jgi:RNA polymerase sigma factor (sigma-70 family)
LKTKKAGFRPAFFYAQWEIYAKKEVAPGPLLSSIIVNKLKSELKFKVAILVTFKFRHFELCLGGCLQNRHKELLELLDRSGDSLYTLLTRLTLREDTAEELMQELFIKLSNSKGFARCTNRDAYARRAAINLAFDRRRKFRQKLQFHPQLCEPVSSEGSPLGKLIRSEELEGMLDAIGRLNKSSRQAVVMRYIQQQSYEDIAEQMEKTPHHVRAICSRAVNRLRDMFGTNRQDKSVKEIKNAEER